MNRGVALTIAVATAVLTGCSSEVEAPEVDSPVASAPPVYGSPADPSLPAPSSVATDPEPTQGPDGARSVRLTYADWNAGAQVVEAGGILPDVVESDGVCTLTLSKDDASVTATITGLPDARSTNCGGLVIAGESLSAGKWNAVISYRSSRTEASSEPAQVQIP